MSRPLFEEYRFSDAAHALYEFLWHEVCDWYIEMIKQRLYYTDDLNAKHTAQTVAAQILEGTMRLLHPMMPVHHRRDLATASS